MDSKRYEVFALNDKNKKDNFAGVVEIIRFTPDVLVIKDKNGGEHTYNGPFNIELRNESLKITIRKQ